MKTILSFLIVMVLSPQLHADKKEYDAQMKEYLAQQQKIEDENARQIKVYDKQAQEAGKQLKESARQMKGSAEQLEKSAEHIKKQAEQIVRFDALLDRWEKQADRYEALLEKWESDLKSAGVRSSIDNPIVNETNYLSLSSESQGNQLIREELLKTEGSSAGSLDLKPRAIGPLIMEPRQPLPGGD